MCKRRARFSQGRRHFSRCFSPVKSYNSPDRHSRYSATFSKSYCAMRKRRAQFSLRHRHLVCCSSTMKVQKARAFRVRVLCASLWLSVEIYQYADGAHESLFLKFGFMANAVAFFLPRKCRRITSDPGPGTQSVRYRRTYRSGYAVFPSSHGTSTKFNHRLLSLCLRYEMVHIQG